MVHIDPEVLRRVWQRVRPSQPSPDPQLQQLVVDIREDARFYYLMRRRATGKASALYNRLYLQTAEQVAALKQICALSHGCDPSRFPVPSPKASPQAQLRRCYARARQRQGWYALHCEDPDYSQLLSPLLPIVREQCSTLLQLMTQNRKDPL